MSSSEYNLKLVDKEAQRAPLRLYQGINSRLQKG